ncbi:hypothetical protein [Streptomyces albipurpureus]|uniref:Uncharacterized protein n=1 Tax=Streptomyces albipurpureus TaxID=2897419 RepID=A0ABT0UN18_9ACTN|nr:hypothetical protein [Streptomyces sp. CWNU-1]MCM2390013.1 hypothetical protein [Streptomyces sp. CWNU-1]
MQLFPTSLFSDGPVLRVLDLAIAAQESGGKLSLDDELQRYIRLVRGNWVANWNCSVYASSGVLDYASDSVAQQGGLDSFPPEFKEKAARAAGDMDPADYLRTLAELLRIADRQGVPEYRELPLSGWEFLQTFPHLFGFDVVLADEGDLPFAGLVERFATAEHPFCHERSAALATEAQRALVLFPGGQCLKERLSWATHDGLTELIDTINNHMQREHS